MSSNQGKFIWYDLMTTDTKAAESFYRSVMGWDMKDAGMAGPPYTLLSTGPTMVGGLMPIPEDARAKSARPCWSGYIGVDDVDAFAERVKSAGGSILRPPQDIPGVGRFAVAADPHGAIFILFKGTNAQAPEAAAPAAPGHVGWRELQAGDLQTEWAFYSGLFHWTKADAVDMGPMGIYQTFAAGNGAIGGMMTKTPQTPATYWLYYFNVDSIDAAAARVTKAGGQIIHGPNDVPGGRWIVQCIDPQGAMFALLGPKS